MLTKIKNSTNVRIFEHRTLLQTFSKADEFSQNLEAPSASPREKVQRFVLKNNPKIAGTPKEAGSQQIQRSGKMFNYKKYDTSML